VTASIKNGATCNWK